MKQRYHFVGIGGAGMSALARVLAARGESVSGSDMADSPTRAALERELGVPIPVGHQASNVGDATEVVASAAIKDANPELVYARAKGIPVISRAAMLGRVMNLHADRIAVSGTHGKTTTSGMLAVVLEDAGLDPTALIGGDVVGWGANARVGNSGVFVAEACEAFGSFLELHPTISIVTNIEADHLDHYGTLNAIVDAFCQFLASTTRLVVLSADDPHTPEVRGAAGGRVVTVGLSADADLRGAPKTGQTFEVFQAGQRLGDATLNIPGVHNVRNALAVIAVAMELGVPFDRIVHGLAKFHGTGRRYEKLGETADGILVIDDYAHHPTEIRATLAAARKAEPSRRIVAVFQPHLPSRTRDQLGEFAISFKDADIVVQTDIYLSREQPIPGLDGSVLAMETRRHSEPGKVIYVADKGELPQRIAEIAKPGDLVLTLGAGDIRAAGEGFLRLLNA
ncbi:MAG: UDP-N-acetylmuramate--L-alanine ligase [Capsulimonadaceae bacterium]|nr:UDP-N-acetylmuramate--L-alanine ligase [Capsulimonadaceae bacterium]